MPREVCTMVVVSTLKHDTNIVMATQGTMIGWHAFHCTLCHGLSTFIQRWNRGCPAQQIFHLTTLVKRKGALGVHCLVNARLHCCPFRRLHGIRHFRDSLSIYLVNAMGFVMSSRSYGFSPEYARVRSTPFFLKLKSWRYDAIAQGVKKSFQYFF